MNERYQPTVGVQSFTYREFTVPEFAAELDGTTISTVELCPRHVSPAASDDAVDEVVDRLSRDGLDVCGYGVQYFPDDATPREAVDLVDRLGGEYLSVDVSPDDGATFRDLIAAARDLDVDVAIHNHGPDATYSTAEDVRRVLDDYAESRLGACVDSGHLLRSGESPADVLPVLGDRVLALHVKDYDADLEEAIPGDGRLDLSDLLDLLVEYTDYDGPLVVEYERHPENPTPAVTEAVRRILAAASGGA